MRTITKCAIWLGMTAGLMFGITQYHGQLMDASCYNQGDRQMEKSWVQCAPTTATTTFAIHTGGRVRMLDDAGNAKASAAFQEGVLKRDPNGDMPVVVSGYRHGNTIRVEGIRARGSDTSVH
jgi:hypothetical protein